MIYEMRLTMQTRDRYVNASQAAALVGYSTAGFLKLMRRDGGLHFARIGTGRFFIRKTDLAEWLAARGMPTLEEQAA